MRKKRQFSGNFWIFNWQFSGGSGPNARALLFQPVPPHLLLQKYSQQISHDFSFPQIEPLYFLPAMEVVPAPWTDAAVVESCSRFFKQLGQKPAILKKEVPGFLINRVQSMLYREAYRLVHVSFL